MSPQPQTPAGDVDARPNNALKHDMMLRKQDSLLADIFGFAKIPGIFGPSSSEKQLPIQRAKSAKMSRPTSPKVFPRRIFTEGWDTKPPCAVIVTIRSNGSYDRMFRDVLQHSPNRDYSVALFEMDYETISTFFSYLITEGSIPDQDSKTAIRQVMDAIELVDPGSVLFNFECCAFCTRKEFRGMRDKLMQFLRALINRGYMAMFSDFSLKGLIAQWDPALLGPNPFHHIGKCEDHIELVFDCNELRNCASAQLRNLGSLYDGIGKATMKCMGNNIIYTLREPRQYEHALYTVDVLSIATDFGKFWTLDPKQHKMRKLYLNDQVGYAGHVMLTYRSGGRILASAGHWMDLHKVDALPQKVIETMELMYGSEYATDIKTELDLAPSDDTVCEIVQRSVRQIVLSSAPCSYSMRSNNASGSLNPPSLPLPTL